MDMQLQQSHVSPDGCLKFIVTRAPDGDLTLGFEGFAWHTHADILASIAGLHESVAVERFVSDLLTNRLIIAVATTLDGVRDVWITDDPASEFKYKPNTETLHFRLWNGASAEYFWSGKGSRDQVSFNQ